MPEPTNASHSAYARPGASSADDMEPRRGPEANEPEDSNGQDSFQHDGEAPTIEQPRVDVPDAPVETSAASERTAQDTPDATTEPRFLPDASDATRQPEDSAASPSPPPPPPPVLTTQAPQRGRHLRRGGLLLDRSESTPDQAAARRRVALLCAAASPAVLIAIIIVAWAIDNAFHSGQVQRNVELAGHGVGGATGESLPGVIKTVTNEVGEREVVVVIKGEETSATASDLGVQIDEQATVEAANKVGRSGSLFLRPFRWVGSFFSSRQVAPVYAVSERQISTAIQELQNAETEDSATPVEPRVELANGEFVMVPGRAGTDLDISKAASDLLADVQESDDPTEPIVLTTDTTEVEPTISDQQAVDLANQANSLTQQGLTLVVDGEHTRELSGDRLREWTHPVLTPEDQRLDFDIEAAGAAVPELFSDLNREPKNASISLADGKPRITGGEPGYTCCGEDVGPRVWQALQEGHSQLELETDKQDPEYTQEDMEGWGIKQPIGGSRAWQSGQGDISYGKAGFTTFEVGSGGRAHNIRRMADEVNGAVIPPDGTFSINDHMGARQCPPFQEGGAIVEGELVEECGGGTSQFATTMFNAAYWAGMDISGYKSHSRYFDRYPRGREATMGAPGSGLDVVVTNNTPYGVLIQTSWEGDTVTVTLWSTPHFTVEDQGLAEEKAGTCESVTNTRKRTDPSGAVKTDNFHARYSTVEGETC